MQLTRLRAEKDIDAMSDEEENAGGPKEALSQIGDGGRHLPTCTTKQ